ncbi:hypothetical protein WN944_021879 [Citrus x changshan-huyou]|uniref:Uncharacterized protein n=1 Tax=Citrus x changshan-huyou TaxID=2935761 RepID=A0AAP0N0N8_9ROSI
MCVKLKASTIVYLYKWETKILHRGRQITARRLRSRQVSMDGDRTLSSVALDYGVNVQQEMVQDMNKMETMSLMAAYGSEYAWIESIHCEAEVPDLRKVLGFLIRL